MDLANILPAMPDEIRNTISPALNWIEREKQIADIANQSEVGKMVGYNCPLCMNRGYFYRVTDDGNRYLEECSCMEIRRTRRYLRESGLFDMAERYTFDAWQSQEPWQERLIRMAKNYASNPSDWLFLAGRPGTGKTHICTAVCNELMKNGYRTRYMLWRDISVRAKAAVNDEHAYREIVDPLKKARVLYIDDLFKTGKGERPTTGDVNLAFELLNTRYNDERKLTILSSELTVNEILKIDEAVGSRILQRSRDHYADLSSKTNWRLK